MTAGGYDVLVLSERGDDPAWRVSIGTTNLAKGLEFKAAAVMACDDDVLPLRSRIESVADELELDDIYGTEREFFDVAFARARDHLLISATTPHRRHSPSRPVGVERRLARIRQRFALAGKRQRMALTSGAL